MDSGRTARNENQTGGEPSRKQIETPTHLRRGLGCCALRVRGRLQFDARPLAPTTTIESTPGGNPRPHASMGRVKSCNLTTAMAFVRAPAQFAKKLRRRRD
jgi:hypothetical protein